MYIFSEPFHNKNINLEKLVLKEVMHLEKNLIRKEKRKEYYNCKRISLVIKYYILYNIYKLTIFIFL